MSDANFIDENSSEADAMDYENNDCPWKGNAMEEIYYGVNQWELGGLHLPPVTNRRDHVVLYELPVDINATQPPTPHKGHMKWDSNHVRLPCSPQNEYLVTDENDANLTIKKKRWEIIKNALQQPIRTSRELEKAILSYNTKYAKQWKFYALHELFENELDESESTAFFNETLPQIIRLALRLPELIPSAIPLLKHGINKSISLSQQQVACLLANAFLCTFPRRNAYNRKSEYRNFPSINFNSLYQMRNGGDQVLEKIKCICFYFRTICKKMPQGVITFTRRTKSPADIPDWSKCESSFNEWSKLHISSDGTIEDDGCGLLQVDFANKYVGGGVLNTGCVQEEIRFVICPELLCSRLFTEQLDLNECLIVMGCERFNSYTGYASSFKWTGGHEDTTPVDQCGRRKCTIVAIDAICFREQSHQYQEELMKRELNKAFVGFHHELNTPAPGVATGNWGCGAFNGDKSLKSLLQLMVCCVTNRPLVYFTFGDTQLRDDFYSMFQFLTQNKVKIAELWNYLRQFRKHKLPAEHLYPFIIQSHRDAGKCQTSTNAQIVQSVTTNSSTANKAKSNSDQTITAFNNDGDDDDDVFDDLAILEQVREAEAKYLTKPSTSSSTTAILSPKIGNALANCVIKRKQTSKEYDDKIPADRTCELKISGHRATNEAKEKRQRSLLDCLDQSYYTDKEMPAKMNQDEFSAASSSTECIEIVDDLSNNRDVEMDVEVIGGSASAIDPSDKANAEDDTNEALLLNQMGTPVISTVNNLESTIEIESSQDSIPGTPPSAKPYSTISKNQKSLFDFFSKG